MKGLCDEKTIDSMFIFKNRVYVIRDDKYWVFTLGVDIKKRPFGQLIEANKNIGNKWKGMDGKDNSFTINDNKIIAISDNEVKELKPNGQTTKESIVPTKTDTEEKEIVESSDR